MIISDISNYKILTILRAENKLEDFIGTLAKYLPIFWQGENLQFVSRWMNVRVLRWPRNTIIEVLIYFAFKIFVPQIITWKPALSLGQRNTFFLHLNILRYRQRNKIRYILISTKAILTFYSTIHYVNMIVKLPKSQLFLLALYLIIVCQNCPMPLCYFCKGLYKGERGAPVWY